MAIIMNQAEQVFTLQTKRTTYQMKAGDYGILLHLYYGARVEDCTMDYLLHRKDVGFSGNPYEAGEDRTFSLDTLPQEFPSYGVGDYRNNCVGVCQADGTRAADFRYVSWEIREGAHKIPGLPCLFDEDETAETLVIPGGRGVFPEAGAVLRRVCGPRCDRPLRQNHQWRKGGGQAGEDDVRLSGTAERFLGSDSFPRAARHGAKAGAPSADAWDDGGGKPERHLQPSAQSRCDSVLA